ncbi:ABC transporter substrate-binding protein [Hydrogenophaga sp. RWCD_12]|uniref:ABC transporter substrate-binding protein n=1 Tax=Hydrogenophaga sp. RWCD_12 TaxID=3391190 RepID=UPI0039847ED1
MTIDHRPAASRKRMPSRPSTVLAALFAALALCATPVFAQSAKDVLVIGKTADPQTLDPGVTMDNNDWTASYHAYQRLVRYQSAGGKGSTEVEPELAESWKVSKDGLTWDFKLKAGNKFDDGTTVDAAAVKFTFDRLFALKQGPSEAFPADTVVTVTGPMSVRFKLATAYTPFLYTLANNGAGIVNPKVQAKVRDGDAAKGWLAGNTAGSGPYRLVSWEKGQSLVLEPNPHFAGPKAAFSKVRIKIIGEASARRLQLESGDLDIAEDLPSDQLSAMKGKSGLKIEEFPSLSTTILYLNNTKPGLDKPEVRRAISWAVDYTGIIDGILDGKAKQLRGPIPVGMWGADPGVFQYKLDLAKAKAEFAKAGNKPSKLSFLYSDRDPRWEPIGLTLQANLAPLGIEVKLEKLAQAAFRERLGKGDFEIAIGNWSPDFADPYMFMNFWFDSKKQGMAGNRAFYNNPKVDSLIRSAASETAQAQRVKLYKQAQDIVVQEAPYVLLYQKNSQIAMRDRVSGFVFNPMLEQIYNFGGMSKSR